ncbi:MAG: Tfp pilus assembly protein FimT/FimU [Lachnospiraceae bacterium]
MSKYKKQNGKGNLGFTLIEMIVTVAIVAIFLA